MPWNSKGIALSEMERPYLDEKQSESAIAQKLGVRQSTVSRRLRKAKVTRSSSEGFKLLRDKGWRAHKLYSVNQLFFKTWTPQSAWVLGWIASDGHIDLKDKRITLALSERDAAIVYKIRELLTSSHPIKLFPGKLVRFPHNKSYYCQGIARLVINSEQLCLDASNLLNSLNDIPLICLGHFIRGLFEGDGNGRMIHKPFWTGSEITIAGQYNLLSTCLDLLRQNLVIDRGSIIRHGHDNCWILGVYNKLDCSHLFQLMYNKAGGFFLPRKKNKLKELEYANTG